MQCLAERFEAPHRARLGRGARAASMTNITGRGGGAGPPRSPCDLSRSATMSPAATPVDDAPVAVSALSLAVAAAADDRRRRSPEPPPLPSGSPPPPLDPAAWRGPGIASAHARLRAAGRPVGLSLDAAAAGGVTPDAVDLDGGGRGPGHAAGARGGGGDLDGSVGGSGSMSEASEGDGAVEVRPRAGGGGGVSLDCVISNGFMSCYVSSILVK